MRALAGLMALKRLDEEILETERRIAALEGEVAHIERRIAAEQERFTKRLEEHRALRLKATQKAMEADEIDEKIRTYQHKLDHDIIPYKEMEYLKEQVEILKGRIDAVEEEAIKLMEEVEEDERRLKEEEREHRERIEALEEERERTRERVRELRERSARLRREREEAKRGVPAHLLSHYERLREMYPDPMVPIVNGVCSGCHLNISEITLDKARRGEVVTCENCSRYLYLESL